MKKIATVMLLFVIAAACNKYEDGPKLSLRSRKARVINEWKIDKYYVDGVDKTTDFKNAFPNYTVVFEKSGNYTISFSFGSSTVSETGTWELSSSKSFVIRHQTSPSVQDHSNEITRLKNDELATKYYDSNGALIEMKFLAD